ncbi:hypothetical protein [Methylobacterium gnaphalii]|uniref:Peptidoglycan binding-like domain-containing protein n=1 Tax=Methylobacterium gnaphalii TaxID=1010610 RepID=A0A512JR71_9HYPH|nr:hypothetical protein [Methylobacterium gnaphalii]GEP12468.1 hypothetical protein MGN01_43130 [Methylobacterium gnaphalii]GJD71445.1 hypothetical protein MMMDOFMJ_4404 [Methylobacterium gnaphalii]GLS50588.1 hypothetical protein GCM10007885_34410 [Methylobacterium gnaphalii]
MLAPPPAPAKRLLDFIASKEAPKGYDTVYGNHQASMPKSITSMTIDEVIADGPRRTKAYGSSAAGRYQFMAATLTALKKTLGLTGSEVMTPALQDALGYQLLKQRGYAAFMAGSMSVATFGLHIAQEWASFPVLADTKGQKRSVKRGQSYYAGDGLNHSLIGAAEVERALNSMRAAPVLTVPDASAVVVASRVETVPGPSVASQSWLGRLFGKKPPEPAQVSRPGLKGDPALYDVQKQLRDRAYYTKRLLDGLNGPLTQSAVAQARKDNNLGYGGIDAAFLAALPKMSQRPVSVERATLPMTKAVAAKPELFNPLGWLGGTGVASLATAVASGSGLLDQVQTAAGKVNDVAGSVQTGIGYATAIAGFLVEHKSLVFVAIGVFLVVKAVLLAADIVTKIRAAFFLCLTAPTRSATLRAAPACWSMTPIRSSMTESAGPCATGKPVGRKSGFL